MWLSKHFSIEYRLIVACTVTLRFHVISHGWPPKQATPYVTIILTVRSLRTRKGENTTTPDLSPFPTSSLKTGQSPCDARGGSYNHRQKCWKGCFFTSFFPSSSRPWPNVQQNVNICARNCPVISQHWIGQGRRGIFRKRENSLFEH